MDPTLLRILDANANRAREALRILEDLARFSLNHTPSTETLKHLRHDLAATLADLPMAAALQTRDTPHDVGTSIKTDSEFRRPSLHQIASANAKRLSESLRSLEECAKIDHPASARALEQLRYRGYDAERTLLSLLAQSDAIARFQHVRLYVLLTESLCAIPWQTTLTQILAAAVPFSQNNISPLAIQLREKDLSDADLLSRARHLVAECHANNALAIINDRPDIAHLAAADGIHLGQTDLPAADIRKWMPPQTILGVSTENLDQAHAAAAAGTSYVAVGPMFNTTTKLKPRLAGPPYAAAALSAINLPLVAIGGITPENIAQLTTLGIKTVAVSASVLRTSHPGEIVRTFLHALPPI